MTNRFYLRFSALVVLATVLLVTVVAAAGPTIDGRLYPTLREWTAEEAVASSAAGVHAAVTDNGQQRVVTTGITNPPCPRNITVTAGGTAADIKNVSVTIVGKRAKKVITETIGPFTLNTTGTVAGSKIFDEVTSITIPAHDGTGATTSVGFGELLGLSSTTPYPVKLAVYDDGVADVSAVLTASAGLESTYLDLSTNLDGNPVALIYLKR